MLDAGLNCRGAYLTDPEAAAGLGRWCRRAPLSCISLHGTPRQWGVSLWSVGNCVVCMVGRSGTGGAGFHGSESPSPCGAQQHAHRGCPVEERYNLCMCFPCIHCERCCGCRVDRVPGAPMDYGREGQVRSVWPCPWRARPCAIPCRSAQDCKCMSRYLPTVRPHGLRRRHGRMHHAACTC